MSCQMEQNKIAPIDTNFDSGDLRQSNWWNRKSMDHLISSYAYLTLRSFNLATKIPNKIRCVYKEWEQKKKEKLETVNGPEMRPKTQT